MNTQPAPGGLSAPDLDQRPPYVLTAMLEANGLAELTRQREAEVRAWSAANCPPEVPETPGQTYNRKTKAAVVARLKSARDRIRSGDTSWAGADAATIDMAVDMLASPLVYPEAELRRRGEA